MAQNRVDAGGVRAHNEAKAGGKRLDRIVPAHPRRYRTPKHGHRRACLVQKRRAEGEHKAQYQVQTVRGRTPAYSQTRRQQHQGQRLRPPPLRKDRRALRQRCSTETRVRRRLDAIHNARSARSPARPGRRVQQVRPTPPGVSGLTAAAKTHECKVSMRYRPTRANTWIRTEQHNNATDNHPLAYR